MNLILGGTHGLGAEIAKQLHENGEETFVAGRSYDESKHGAGMAIDLADENDARKLQSWVTSLGGTALQGFYWISGYGYNGDFTDQPDVEKMARVNFAGVLPIAQLAWRKMSGQGETSNFVIVSSTTGVRARNNEAVYAGTKFAQVGFGRSLGLESERLGLPIHVALFLPGGMRTPFWKGNEPANFDDYNDPAKVAAKILAAVRAQEAPFYEETIERGGV